MKLRVQYMAQLREAAGRSEEEVELPEGTSLAALLVYLAARHGEVGSHLVKESGQAHPSLLLVVNGSAVAANEAAATVLRPDDVVMLLPPISGG